MKNQYLMTAAFGALLIFGQVNADEDDLSKDQIPKAVISAFEKAYPNAKDVKFEKETFEGKEAYEVEYKEKDREYDLLYSADGTLLQKEEEINSKSLPEPVTQAINKMYPQAEIKEAEKLVKPDGTLAGYEVEIKTAGKKVELELDANGKILKTEND
ncbi:PepSY-like domain-containing protein [Methylobacter sp. YRD-M1]|uniref:PepSY-like domain-containing protein n=1 Tax=Methylobacter sp. YRD-M1 TaxID=2911520 RepID=UPI00227A57C5|nr:PepSY-like domain-containing protein [Methylobacter sp. YRD-M1]WAK03400.1 PepSY-like domain-containing protein [Methylobacter sp. YRD-M1]